MISRSILNKGNHFTRVKNKVKGLYIEGEGRLRKQMFRCGSSLTYLPRESVLVCSVSEPGDTGFPVYLACPVTGLTGGLEGRFRKCFLLSINEHQIILQCALVYTLWQTGRLETEFSKAEETAQLVSKRGNGEVRSCFRVLVEIESILNFLIFPLRDERVILPFFTSYLFIYLFMETMGISLCSSGWF